MKTLQLEEGKYYRTRRGKKVGPAKGTALSGGVWRVGGFSYYPNGMAVNSYDSCPLDLVALWEDELPTELAVGQMWKRIDSAPGSIEHNDVVTIGKEVRLDPDRASILWGSDYISQPLGRQKDCWQYMGMSPDYVGPAPTLEPIPERQSPTLPGIHDSFTESLRTRRDDPTVGWALAQPTADDPSYSLGPDGRWSYDPGDKTRNEVKEKAK